MRRGEFTEDFFRHMVLNSIRGYRTKFKDEYGEVVLCCDGRGYWRKNIFKHYKGKRKEGREKSALDWDMIYGWINQIKDDLRENFPYKVIEVKGAEADDVIGFLAAKYAAHEPIMIVSADKDFQQLQRYPGVMQFSPKTKKLLKCADPMLYLKEHTIRGDAGDGVPNILSDEDTFMVADKKQKSVLSKKLERWLGMKPEDICKDAGCTIERYNLNKQLVDLTCTPSEIKQAIATEFDEAEVAPRAKIMAYFMKHRLRHLSEYLHEF